VPSAGAASGTTLPKEDTESVLAGGEIEVVMSGPCPGEGLARLIDILFAKIVRHCYFDVPAFHNLDSPNPAFVQTKFQPVIYQVENTDIFALNVHNAPWCSVSC